MWGQLTYLVEKQEGKKRQAQEHKRKGRIENSGNVVLKNQ